MRILLPFIACLFLAETSGALDLGGANDITAVCGRTSPDYVRSRQADGSFTPETYAFGEGGSWSGAMTDLSIDRMTFLDVAHVIATPLAGKNYILEHGIPSPAGLPIMVYWGTTHAPEHASGSNAYDRASSVMKNWVTGGPGFPPPGSRDAMIRNTASSGRPTYFETLVESQAMGAVEAENRMRDKEDALNASIRGLRFLVPQTADSARTSPLDIFRQDMLDELENDRYFVVLMAYDFQLMWKEKKHKLLWETRFSIRQRQHEFDKDLPAMAAYASKFFGQDSQGLVREAIPLGHVDIGEMKLPGFRSREMSAPSARPRQFCSASRVNSALTGGRAAMAQRVMTIPVTSGRPPRSDQLHPLGRGQGRVKPRIPLKARPDGIVGIASRDYVPRAWK